MPENQSQPIDNTWGAIGQNLPLAQPKPQPESTPVIPLEELNPKKTSIFKELLKIVVIFLASFAFIYLFLTFPAQWQKIKYFVGHLGKANQAQTITIPQNLDANAGSEIFLTTIQDALQKVPPRPTQPKHTLDISDLKNNYLLVPKIEVNAPIVWNSSVEEKEMLQNLQNGVAHYQGTALPDEALGNVFISGHSSYYWWDKGQYKTVFATLDNLTNGDEIALAYENKVYIYQVFDKVVVKPEQVEVLQPTDEPILSLMTCVPVGTNLKRLVIKARRIDITTTSGEDATPTETPTSTPSATPVPTTTPFSEPLGELLPWI